MGVFPDVPETVTDSNGNAYPNPNYIILNRDWEKTDTKAGDTGLHVWKMRDSYRRTANAPSAA